METLRFEIQVGAPIEDIWHAWTDADTITEWFSPEANIEPRLGGAYELFFDPQDHDRMSTKGCVITEFEPMDHLGFGWKGPDQFAGLMNDTDDLTHVRVAFRKDKGGTRVSLAHGGWGEGDDWAEAREWHRRAWEGVLNQLESFISHK
ncbi:MAG: SRPBCC domain-containing protein [Candidatus Bathyarchaeota archaeon]|nr:SRPBCC domain-containing protein [Candidatus Bathyarchaeota archaeon]